MMKQWLFGVALCAITVSAQAADNKYSAWSDPNAPKVQSSDMVKELRALVSEAEKARAADPNFLRDLKALANKYDLRPQTLLFSDDFADGNFTQNPTWRVTSGKYWVERGYGLRSFVDATQTATTPSQNQRKLSNEEVLIGVLGAVLGGKTQSSSGNNNQQQATTQNVEAAEIYLPTKVNNAFSLKMTMSSWKNKGQFEFGPYQGTNRNTGYRLVYRPGHSPALQLIRNYTSSSSVVAVVNTLKLEDQKNHEVEWIRSNSGDMKVSIDGRILMQTTDHGFKDDFSGFVIKNRGGDYIVNRISATGM